MKFANTLTFSVIAILVLSVSGCSDSDSGSSNSPPQSPKQNSVTGKVADGYLQGATVCFDMNRNFVCDGDETTVTTDESGSYTLSVPEDVSQTYPIIATVSQATIDQDTNAPVRNAYTLVSPPGRHAFVSPITTLLALQSNGSSDEALSPRVSFLLNQLGLSSDVDLFADYIEKRDDESYRTVHQAAQLVARELGAALTTLHQGERGAVASPEELTVVTGILATDLDDYYELFTLSDDDFDADAFALSLEGEWQEFYSGIRDDFDTVHKSIVSYIGKPILIDVGVYRERTANGEVTEKIEVLFAADVALGRDYNLIVRSGSGLEHKFSQADIKEQSSSYLLYSLSFPAGEIADGYYDFYLENSNDMSEQTAIASIYFSSSEYFPEAQKENWLPNGNLQLVKTPYGESQISFPTVNDELFVRISLRNPQGDMYYQSDFERGMSFYLKPTSDVDVVAGSTLNVEVSDNDERFGRNFVSHLYSAPIVNATSQSSVTFSRIYKRWRERDTETTSSYVWQFNASPMVQDEKASPLVPLARSIEIDYFDSMDQQYKRATTHDLDYNQIMALGDDYYVDDEENGLTLSNSLDAELYQDLEVNFLDAFYQSSSEIPYAMYRIRVVDGQGETSDHYDYFRGGESGFDQMIAENIKHSKSDDGEWLILEAPDLELYDEVYYQFNLYVNYTKDGDSRELFVINTPRTALHRIFWRFDDIDAAMASFADEYEPDSVESVVLRASAWDSKSNSLIDTRSESKSINVSNLFDLQDL
ncbi:hypothetical protein L4D06_03340 [Enterovibrio makurazakiensis]|uniref:hypothetical protein n=1 Tax=Enterovibrio makurazakiensis TaxID=2910232 RepID=UPI003D1B3254